jgi:NAD(P)-dependent dehydrogenase (short-subunit alcohol dehydrogenase family)
MLCVVTGGSSGLGLKIGEGLARAGHHVLITSRSSSRGESAALRIREATGNPNVESLPLDLASFDSIRTLVAEIKRRGLNLQILVNNAGVFTPRGRTREGFELIWGTNFAGPFLLTTLLRDSLQPDAKILNVCSDFAYKTNSLKWDSFTNKTGLNAMKCYADSKLCLLMWTLELGDNARAFHPGFVQSNISIWSRMAARFNFGLPARKAAAPALEWLLAKTKMENFFGPNGQPLPLPPLAADKALREELLKRTEAWTGVRHNAASTTPDYNPEDGIFGPFRLDMSTDAIANLTRSIRDEVLPRPALGSTQWKLGSLFVLLLQRLRKQYYMERHLDVPAIWNLCLDPQIREALKPHLGENLVLWRSEIWVNKPSQRLIGAWHHDTYPKLVTGTGKAVNIYIALTDVDHNNGFEYLSLSQLRTTRPRVVLTDIFSGNHFFKLSPEEERCVCPISLKAGEFILFTNDLVHRSVLNTSGRTRVAITLRVIQPTLTARAGYSTAHRPLPLG